MPRGFPRSVACQPAGSATTTFMHQRKTGFSASLRERRPAPQLAHASGCQQLQQQPCPPAPI